MNIHYNVPGQKRKELVKAISTWTGEEIKYCGAPSFAYEVGGFKIDRDGNLSFDDQHDPETIERLQEHLYDEGFECDTPEQEEPAAPVEQETEPHGYGLTVTMDAGSFSTDALNNLHSIIAAKRGLICKALGLELLPVQVSEQAVSFPWFEDELGPEQVKAYTHFIAALCEMARNQKRITAKEKEIDNDKYAFRCFLLRLGFIGDEYKAERKILLSKLSGSSAFKSGNGKVVEACE